MRLTPQARCARAVLLAALAWPGAAGAADEGEVLRLRAERLAAAGRCEEALAIVEPARRSAPGNARLAHLAGQCLIRLRRYPEAVASLEAARALDAGLPDLDLQLGIARFHQGDRPGAADALRAARLRSPGRAELDLYEGLLLLDDDAREAALAFERARRLDAPAVEPLASYYEGIAWLRLDERQRAREALERVRSEAPPDSPWAEAAERALASAASGGLGGRRGGRAAQARQAAAGPLGGAPPSARWQRWAVISAGAEYDDNVVLRGDDVVLPRDISDKGDVRAVWTVELGAELFRGDDWSGGALLAYYGSAQGDLHDFDVQAPTATVWADRQLAPRTTARLQYDFGYVWAGGDPYLLAHSFTPALLHDSELGSTRLFAQLSWENYFFGNDDVPDVPDGPGVPGAPCPGAAVRCGPAGLNEDAARNRDGFRSIVGFDHAVPVARIETLLRGGYRYQRFSARGREYSFQGHEVVLGTRTRLPFALVLDLEGGFTYRPYRHPSTFPDPPDAPPNGTEYRLSGVRRREKEWRFDAVLERPITDRLTASLRYDYLDNHSNRDVFDYHRHIVGGYLTVWLGR